MQLNSGHIRIARDDALTRECLVCFIEHDRSNFRIAREFNGLLRLENPTVCFASIAR